MFAPHLFCALDGRNANRCERSVVLRQLSEFRRAIGEFRAWATDFPSREKSGEWECAFDQWPKVHAAVSDYLEAYPPRQWTDDVVDLLLYILARDNEIEWLKKELIKRPDHLLTLAGAGVASNERDARWQLADALGDPVIDPTEAEALLLRYVRDDDEYVNRRALLALGRRQSPAAEALAHAAWETDHEHQRMAALDVLSSLNSPTLSTYLALAQKDGREYLANFATEIASRQKPA
jgi:hypothetical protein